LRPYRATFIARRPRNAHNKQIHGENELDSSLFRNKEKKNLCFRFDLLTAAIAQLQTISEAIKKQFSLGCLIR
jgi:hypothetical protein